MAESYYIDVVLCLDLAEGTPAIMKALRKQALPLLQKTLEGMGKGGRRLGQVRVKVITFGDYQDFMPVLTESTFFTLPKEGDDLLSFIKGIIFPLSNDTQKNTYEAIITAMRADWTSGGDDRRQIVFVLSPSPAYRLGEWEAFAECASDVPELEDLSDMWDGNSDYSTGETYCPIHSRLISLTVDSDVTAELYFWDREWSLLCFDEVRVDDADVRYIVETIVEES